MLGAAIARTEGDQPGVLGLGQRHPRLGDLGQAGHRGAAGQDLGGVDRREIGTPPGQCRLGRGERQDQRGRQQRGKLGEGNRGEFAARGGDRLGPEARRLGAERGGGIGEVADHRGGQFRRQRDRYRAGQRVASRQSQGDGAAAGQDHVQWPRRDVAQAAQIVLIDEFGGESEHGAMVAGEQHRLAAPQCGNRPIEGATAFPACRLR